MLRSFSGLGVLAGVAGGAWLAAGAGAGPAPNPTTNAEALAPFFEQAMTGRVDIVALGDSNQLFQGHGWDHGWGRAASVRFGMYATPLFSAGENSGNGAGQGYGATTFSTGGSGQFLYAGAPVFHDAPLSPSPGLRPLNYTHIPAMGAAGTGFNLGFFMDADCPVDVNAALRFHYVYGEFLGATGSFNPMVRLQQPPFSTLITSPTVSCAGPAPAIVAGSLDLPGATRNAALNFRIAPWGQVIFGPFIWYYQRAENLERPRGASFHTLYGFGGQSARDMAASVQAADDSYLTLFFGQVRALQGETKRVLVRINTGLNDRNEEGMSAGPNPQTPGNSAGAFADNLQAIMNRIGAIWALNSWDPEELFFLLTVSHPIDDPDDEQLLSYRAAAEQVALANPRAATVRLDALTNASEMLSSGWYQANGFDRNHLTQPAFEELARRELTALRPIHCWADSNGDGLVGFADLNTLLSAFGATTTAGQAPTIFSGDIDADGDVDFTDLNALLSVYGQERPSGAG